MFETDTTKEPETSRDISQAGDWTKKNNFFLKKITFSNALDSSIDNIN